MRRPFAWPIVVMVSTVAALTGFAVGLGPPVAPLLALWFLGVCPGIGWVRLLRMSDPLAEMLLAVALSLSIGAVASVVLFSVGAWSPGLALILTAVAALTGAGAAAMAEERDFREAAEAEIVDIQFEAG